VSETRRNCPECGALAVLFTDYDKNDQSAMGLRCMGRCGWAETMQDLRDENKRLRATLFRIATMTCDYTNPEKCVRKVREAAEAAKEKRQ